MTELDTRSWGGRNAHDPTAVRDDDGVYWLFSTDARSDGPVRGGAQIRCSEDLVTWSFYGWALDGVPAEAAAWSGAAGLWAPDVVRVGSQWRMYYSASTVGSRTSAIGLASAPHPSGPWQDRGVVVTSLNHVEGPNAIDANAVVDAEGRHWLVYGSFFGGIWIVELDPATGRPLMPGAPGVCIARRRAEVEGAVEGAFVVRRPGGGYALIVSYDFLASTYNVRVAVASQITGPYRDASGNDLTDLSLDPIRAGTTILAGYRFTGGRAWLAPGHGAVLTDGGEQFYVHHVRDGDVPQEHEVQVRRLLWTHSRWPLLSPQPYHGEALTLARPDELAGTWEVVGFTEASATITSSRIVTVTADQVAAVTAHGEGLYTGQVHGARIEAVAFWSWDAVRNRAAVSFSAVDGTGHVTFGTKVG